MELVNGIYRYTGDRPAEELNGGFLAGVLEKLTLLLAPFAPHLAEELWEISGRKFSIFDQSWPAYDESVLEEDVVNYGLLINGKVRSQMQVPRDMNLKEIEKRALISGRIPELLAGKFVKKIVVVPGKVVNIVVSNN